jgi:hypothetical protein
MGSVISLPTRTKVSNKVALKNVKNWVVVQFEMLISP